MKKTVLFKLALCFILLSVSLNAQMTKFVQPNMKPERDIYFDGKGVRYSDVVKVKFNGNFIKTASGKKEVLDSEVDDLKLKDILYLLSKKYGKVSIEKVFPAAFWGDTIKINKRTHKKVVTLDMSQIVALNFSKLVPVDSIVSLLQAEPFVAWAEGPMIKYFTAAPNDPRYITGEQWGLANIEAPKAWDITQGNKVISIND